MISVNRRSLLLTFSVIAALSMTACGKKKEVGTPLNSAPVETKEQVQGDLEGGLPAPNDESGQNVSPTPKFPEIDKSSSAPAVPVGSNPKVKEAQAVKRIDLNPIAQDYDSNDANSVTRGDLSKRITGAKTNDGLFYTGSSVDGILTYLRARNEKVGWETRRLNYAAAASVRSAKLTVDSFSEEAIIVLKIEEASSVNTYVLAGSLAAGAANEVKVVSVGGSERTTGTSALAGTIKCLDLDGGCENTLLRLKTGGNGYPSAVINIVFRQSAADAYFHLPAESTGVAEYADIREMIVNSIKRINVDNRISQIRMNSFEVVNGRSGVNVAIQGRNKELLSFSSPLLAPEAGTAVNIGMTRENGEAQESLDLLDMAEWSLKYQNTISEVRMINNNGLGQVRIAIKMRKRASGGGEKFAVTVMRKVKPLLPLNETSLDLK